MEGDSTGVGERRALGDECRRRRGVSPHLVDRDAGLGEVLLAVRRLDEELHHDGSGRELRVVHRGGANTLGPSDQHGVSLLVLTDRTVDGGQLRVGLRDVATPRWVGGGRRHGDWIRGGRGLVRVGRCLVVARINRGKGRCILWRRNRRD